MFISTEHGDIAMRTVVRITHSDNRGHQHAVTDDGKRHRITCHEEVLRVTGTIVQAAADEVADLVWVDDVGEIYHQQDRIIAWHISCGEVMPITATYWFGASNIGYRDGIIVYRRPDGKFEEHDSGEYDSLDAIGKRLVERRHSGLQIRTLVQIAPTTPPWHVLPSASVASVSESSVGDGTAGST